MFAPILREGPHVYLKSYTLQKLKIISVTIFFLVSHSLPVLLLSVLLFFFIIYFYLIYITYKYNKLSLIWQKCMISYLIIFIYAFNDCCLADLQTIYNVFRLLYTKFYLEYYFRLLDIIWKLYILKKKLIILFFTPPQQISTSYTIDPPKKNLRKYAFIVFPK